MAKVGRAVRGFREGDPVLVGAYAPCGSCRWCHEGLMQLCDHLLRPGVELPGTYAEQVAVPASCLYRLPQHLSLVEAAGCQLALGTAWHALQRAKLQPGETILITGAAGSTGSAAVPIAHRHGATVIAVVGSAAKASYVRQLGATWVVEQQAVDLEQEIAQLTNGRGVDVVLDGVGGDLMAKGLRCLRKGGRYILYGAHGGEETYLDLISFFRGYKTLIATTGWTRQDIESVLASLERQELSLSVYKTLPLHEVAEAHRILMHRANLGKVLLTP